jgi:hypothetical protein
MPSAIEAIPTNFTPAPELALNPCSIDVIPVSPLIALYGEVN